jgi:hypothetical protein
MMNHGRKYTLVYPDGSEFYCYFSEVMIRLDRDFNLQASRDLVQKRILSRNDRRALAQELAKPPVTQKEAGAIRWKNMNIPCIHSYDGIEGFSGPVSARYVWETLVENAGKSRPAMETIRMRLRRGIRLRSELLDGRPKKKPLRKNAQIKKVNENKEKKIEETIMDIDEILSRAKCIKPTPCGNEFPPMKDWKPDAKFYRRIAL